MITFKFRYKSTTKIAHTQAFGHFLPNKMQFYLFKTDSSGYACIRRFEQKNQSKLGNNKIILFVFMAGARIAKAVSTAFSRTGA
ncbi:MAG: hypothetical protein J6T71_01660 [Paludibacteraceae bacterium]|nr:hypothetical protein [Paludibacteraceae bacterium]